MSCRRSKKRAGSRCLHPQWSTAKIDQNEMSQWMKDASVCFRTSKYDRCGAVGILFSANDERKGDCGDSAHYSAQGVCRGLAGSRGKRQGTGEETGQQGSLYPSRAWRMLSSAKPEAILFSRRHFASAGGHGKNQELLWKVEADATKLPLPEMARSRITSQLPEYPKIAEEAFSCCCWMASCEPFRDYQVLEAL